MNTIFSSFISPENRERLKQMTQAESTVHSEGYEFQSVQPDMVNHPPHYNTAGIECIEAIRAALTEEEFRGFCKGNAIKYVWREKNKAGATDLSKATWYLNYLSEKGIA